MTNSSMSSLCRGRQNHPDSKLVSHQKGERDAHIWGEKVMQISSQLKTNKYSPFYCLGCGWTTSELSSPERNPRPYGYKHPVTSPLSRQHHRSFFIACTLDQRLTAHEKRSLYALANSGTTRPRILHQNVHLNKKHEKRNVDRTRR